VAKQNTQKPVNESLYNSKIEGKVAKQNTQKPVNERPYNRKVAKQNTQKPVNGVASLFCSASNHTLERGSFF
jgi:hypothetical protein